MVQSQQKGETAERRSSEIRSGAALAIEPSNRGDCQRLAWRSIRGARTASGRADRMGGARHVAACVRGADCDIQEFCDCTDGAAPYGWILRGTLRIRSSTRI